MIVDPSEFKTDLKKNFTFLLLSYQSTSTGQSAHLGRMAGAAWLVTQKKESEKFFKDLFCDHYGLLL